MNGLMQHLVVTPVLLPLAISAAILLVDEQRRQLKRGMTLFAVLALIANAAMLIVMSAKDSVPTVYLIGNWTAPFGITLVTDKLTAIMLMLTVWLTSFLPVSLTIDSFFWTAVLAAIIVSLVSMLANGLVGTVRKPSTR